MARLTAEARRKMPAAEFAGGKGHYPIPDQNHARLALAMVSKYGSAHEKGVVRAAVHRKYPNIK